MTPDLDQALSVKAQLQDTVSPQLQKIERFARTTREAMDELIQSLSDGSGKMGSSASEMADAAQQGTSKLRKDLDGVADSFRDTEETATQSSGKIGKAIEDAMYTQGAEGRIDSLESDLGKLDKTLRGMASTQKSVSGKARSVSAIASDSLNKKVIPAFQELHGTLDEYPDTLEEINALEEDRMKMLEEGGGILGRVKDAASGVGDAFNEIQLGLRDAAALATGGAVGAVGMNVQEKQTGAAQIGGLDFFDTMPKDLIQITRSAETTMDNVQPIVEAMLDLRSTPRDVMAPMVEEIYNIQKATGLAGAEVTQLYDQFARLGGIKGEEMTLLLDQVQHFAQESTASTSEMFSVLQRAGDEMMIFSGDARRAYTESSLAAAASAKNMGLSADLGMDLSSRLMNDPRAMARMQGIMNAQGMGVDVQELVSSGDTAMLLDKIREAMTKQFGEMDLTNAVQRQAAQQLTGGIVSLDELAKFKEGAVLTGEGTGGGAEDMKEAARVEAPGTVADLATTIRGTQTEMLEKIGGTMERSLIEPGRKTVETFGLATDKFEKTVTSMSDWVLAKDEEMGGKLSTGMAAGTLAVSANAGLRGFGAALQKTGIPGMGAVGETIGGGNILGKVLQTGLGIWGGSKMMGMFGEEGAAPTAPSTASTAPIVDGQINAPVMTQEHAQSVLDTFGEDLDLTNAVQRTAFKEMTGGVLSLEEIQEIAAGNAPTQIGNAVTEAVDMRSPLEKIWDFTNDMNPMALAMKVGQSDMGQTIMDLGNPMTHVKKAGALTGRMLDKSLGVAGDVASIKPMEEAIELGQGPAGDMVNSIAKWTNPFTYAAKAGEWLTSSPETPTVATPAPEPTFTPISPVTDQLSQQMDEVRETKSPGSTTPEVKADPNVAKQTDLQTQMTESLRKIADGITVIKDKTTEVPPMLSNSTTVERGRNFASLEEGRS